MTNLYSYPKENIRVLLLENIHDTGATAFTQEGYQIDRRKGSLTEAELIEAIADVHLLGIRSQTKITARVLDAAPHLLAIGAFCIGTNQIDLEAAASRGVAVFNAPFSNTRSVVELTLGDMLALSRRLTTHNANMHTGIWNKSAAGSHELRGQTLGIIGYGHIGSQLSVLAEALGMQVVFYDIADKLAFGNARALASMNEVLEASDIVSIHVDGRPENHNLIGKAQLAHMKRGSLFLNLSRGFIVDDHALAESLTSGHLAGAAVDVYPEEPGKGEPFSSPLQGLSNVILTPHVASGTEEAQADIGAFAASKLISYVNTGATPLCVNLPELELPQQAGRHRLLHIHRNVPGVLARINSALAAVGANIAGQYLGTNGGTGYCIVDIDQDFSQTVRHELAKMPETIKLRVLF